MQTQTLKVVLNNVEFNSMMFIVVEGDNSANVLGRTMTEWVMSALSGYSAISVKIKDFKLDDIKKYLSDSKYTIILFNNLILLTSDDIKRLVDYVVFKGVKACKFSGGYAFETEYLKKAKEVFYDSVYYQDAQDFYMVEDKKQLAYATEILQERIIAEHLANGVDVRSSYIEADVKIGKGTMIFNGNVIKGHTIIGNNVILKEKNVIENCVIGDECCVSGSTLLNSKLEEGVFVKPYCYIEKSELRKNCILDSGIELVGRKTRPNSKIHKKEE